MEKINATLEKINHVTAPYVLHWRINGAPYYSSFRTKKEAMQYAAAMLFTVEF